MKTKLLLTFAILLVATTFSGCATMILMAMQGSVNAASPFKVVKDEIGPVYKSGSSGSEDRFESDLVGAAGGNFSFDVVRGMFGVTGQDRLANIQRTYAEAVSTGTGSNAEKEVLLNDFPNQKYSENMFFGFGYSSGKFRFGKELDFTFSFADSTGASLPIKVYSWAQKMTNTSSSSSDGKVTSVSTSTYYVYQWVMKTESPLVADYLRNFKEPLTVTVTFPNGKVRQYEFDSKKAQQK